MNPWIQFMKTFYAAERAKDNSKCHNRVRISNVSKVYQCKKKMANRTRKSSDVFYGMNPMRMKKNVTKKFSVSSPKRSKDDFSGTNPMHRSTKRRYR
jgi:hypothetical protein